MSWKTMPRRQVLQRQPECPARPRPGAPAALAQLLHIVSQRQRIGQLYLYLGAKQRHCRVTRVRMRQLSPNVTRRRPVVG